MGNLKNENLRGSIEELIRKYSRRESRSQRREDEYYNKEENLSAYGYWSLGYHGGKTDAYSDIVDDLKEIIGDRS